MSAKNLFIDRIYPRSHTIGQARTTAPKFRTMKPLHPRLRVLCALCLLAALRPAAFAQEKTKVACVGDSITAGAGINDPAHNAYPAQLQKLLGDGYLVKNFGVSGRTLLKHGDY